MAYFLPSSVKSRFLRFALAQTGLLDTDALELDKLNFSVGRNSNVEFRDVGLRLEKLTALLQLPPSIRLLAARAVLVRVNIAVDLSIIAEVDGIELRASIDESDVPKKDERHPESLRTPRHRKTARRLQSPSMHTRADVLHYDYDESNIPTAQDLAKSFLDIEPDEEKQELEANLSHSRVMQDSVTSDASSDEMGTGNGLGLPAFLTGVLQGVVDRLKVKIRNVNLRCDTSLRPQGLACDEPSIPVSLALNVASVDVDAVTKESGGYTGRRRILVEGVDLDLLCQAAKSPPASPSTSHSHAVLRSSRSSSAQTARDGLPISVPTLGSPDMTASSVNAGGLASFADSESETPKHEESEPYRTSSAMSTALMTATTAIGRFDDAEESGVDDDPHPDMSSSEIRPGEDSQSYTSRRSQSSSDYGRPIHATDEEGYPMTASVAHYQSSHGSAHGEDPDDLPFQNDFMQTLAYDSARDNIIETFSDHESVSSQAATGIPSDVAGDSSQASPELDESMMKSQMLDNMSGTMFESAMSHDSPPSPDYRRAPGYFPEDSYIAPMPQSAAPIVDDTNLEDGTSTPRPTEAPRPERLAEDVTGADTAETEVLTARKRLLSLDKVSVWLPGSNQSATEKDDISHSSSFAYSPQSSVAASSFARDMPGTFSQYADMGASRRLQASYVVEQSAAPEGESRMPASRRKLDVDLGTLSIHADLASSQLAHQLAALIHAESGEANNHQAQAGVPVQIKPTSALHVSLRLKVLRLALLERLPETSTVANSPSQSSGLDQGMVLIRLEGHDITFGLTPHMKLPDMTFGIRRLVAGSGAKDLLSFKRSSRPDAPDLLVKVQRSRVTVHNKPITDVRAWLRQVHLDLDLLAIDEALESFGGLSGVLEMSASALSGTSEPVKSPNSPQRRGVRFKEDTKAPPPDQTATQELKVNITMQGANVGVRSRSCHLELQCSTIKCNVRPDYVIATIATARLFEPSIANLPSTSRFVVQLKDLRLEHLPTPDHQDLERLVSLITPSKDKYENDDDILIDTFLRQRKKGAILRIRLATVQADVRTWTFIPDIQSLGDELIRFSAVTKYLPEDDRPGLLISPRIIDVNARLPINDNFGLLEVSCRDVELAHIGLPSLLALSIGSIRAGPLGGCNIVHELLRPSEQLPMIMMRMIGGEVEPTVKLKLFNICFEYSVQTLLALTGIDAAPETEKIIDELATSILHIANLDRSASSSSPVGPSVTPGGTPGGPVKRVACNVLLHNCALGLKPRDMEAKGMLMLTNTKLSTVIPSEEKFSASLELLTASLHVIDRESGPTDHAVSLASPTSGQQSPHLDHLAAQGFICVSTIMSARAIVSITEDEADKMRYVDIEVKNKLFLLETCADSTQTLVAILNGLAPPAPPSDEPEFRTEVETLGDMIASFSEDSYAKPPFAPSAVPSTIFDAEESSPLTESVIMDNSFDPLEEGYPLDEEPDFALEDAENDSVTSLLEDEDFYEVTDTPAHRVLDDGDLWAHLRKHCSQYDGNDSKQLRPYYLENQRLDQTESTVLGSPYRFLTPATQFPAAKMRASVEPFPFQVRVRDVHVIWNLYDGYDWSHTRDVITQAVEEVEAKLEEKRTRRRRSAEAEEEEDSVIGDCLFNSIYIGVPSSREASDLRRQISRDIDDLASESESYATSGTSRPTQHSTSRQARLLPRRKKLRLVRSQAHKIAFELKGVAIDFSIHPPGGGDGNGKVQSSVDVRLRDLEIFDNVPTSTWRKFLTYHHDEENMREMMKPMIHIEMLNIRPVPELAATEISLRVTVLPLRLHVDQDALDFITRFFEFKPEATTAGPAADPPFIQRIEVNTVDLCLDYKPKKVDYAGIRSGHAGEFKNFVILDRANIKLKHVIVYGIKGFDALHPTLSDIWTPDVIRTQLPGVLAGLGPVRPLVNLGTGFRDIVAIPVREYKKDGRLVRSVQKGAVYFARNTTAEIARWGAKIAIGTQTVLSGFEGSLGHVQQPIDDDREVDQRRSPYADQPLNVAQGLRNAGRLLEYDLLTAKDAFIAIQGEVLEAGSATGVAHAVARHGATILLRPAIGASRAVGQALMGVGNQVDRTNVRKTEDKYKHR